MGTLAAGGGAAWPAASCAAAHRRGPLPAAPLSRTPAVTRREAPRSASWPGGRHRARCTDRRAKGHSSPCERPQLAGPERRALSGAAPSGVKGAPSGRKPLWYWPLISYSVAASAGASDTAIAANWSKAACRSSEISAAISSGAGRFPVSSRDSSRSQKMSRDALSLATRSS
jgi:hypothetical protein